MVKWTSFLPFIYPLAAKNDSLSVFCHETYGVILQQCSLHYLGFLTCRSFSTISGEVRVPRLYCAVDCGLAVNPDIVEAQLEGGVVFSLTAALFGEITVKNGAVEQCG